MRLCHLAMLAVLGGCGGGARAQEPVASYAERQAALKTAVSQEFRQVERVNCIPAPDNNCAFFGLVIESQASTICSDTVLPVDQYRSATGVKYGLIMKVTIRANHPAPADIETPILFLLPHGEPQGVCAPEQLLIANTPVSVRIPRWKRLSWNGLESLPDAERVQPDFGDILSGSLGGLLGGIATSQAAIRAPGILDWIFNSGRQEPVKLRISSQPAGGIVYVGSRMIGTTEQAFGLTPTQFKNAFVLLKGKKIPINTCTQIGGDSWVRIACQLSAE